MPTRKSDSDPAQTEQAEEASLPSIDEDNPGDAADRTRETSEEEQRETNVVRYLGLFSERSISKNEWEQAGVTDQEGVTWTQDAKSLPIDRFSENALRVLGATGEFQIIRDQ